MKKSVCVLLTALVSGVYAFTVQLQTNPAAPVANEIFSVVLQSDSGSEPEFTLPQVKGLQFGKNISSRRSSISIVNGRQTQSFSYGINALAVAPGEYTIPAFEVKCGDQRARTKPVKFTVLDPAKMAQPDGKNPSRPQMEMRISPDRELYAGETAQLTLELMVPEGVNLNAVRDIRESGFGDALFLPQGRNRSKFIQSFTRQRVYNNLRYTIYGFSAYFQPQQPGEFSPVCEALLQITQPGSDDFFGSSFFAFGNSREIMVRAGGKNITVKPLPPAPADTVNTGLVGNWLFEMNVPLNAEFKTGEVAELTLNVSGDVPVEIFHAPPLEIPNARVYPPEVKRGNGVFSVKYLFVPLVAGAQKITQNFAFFSPEKQRYEISRCAVEFMVVPGSAGGTVAIPKTTDTSALPETPQVREFPLYPLAPDGTVAVPLWENQRGWIILFLAGGIVMMIIATIRKFRKNDPGKEQKVLLRSHLHELAARITPDKSAAEILQKQGMAEIASALDLAPGATAGEIAEKISDPEIKAFFTALNESAFQPGSVVSETPQLRKKLRNYLKKLLLAVVLFSVLPLQADFQRGCAEFDQGKYAQAKEFFHRMLNPEAPAPNAVYNLGCPAYMLGEYPAATIAFERALLLAPGNSRIRGALHDTLAKLPGERKENDGSFSAFAAGLRDRMRPDQYLLAASFCFFVLGILTLCRRFPGKLPAAAALILLIALSLSAVWSQSRYRYSPERARIITSRAELHRIPADNGSVAGIIPGGSEVMITGSSGPWSQISLPGGNSGWVKNSEIERVFPYGIW